MVKDKLGYKGETLVKRKGNKTKKGKRGRGVKGKY
jgi:hypothetical protein